MKKFILIGNERFWVRGGTYGPFAPNSRGELFPELSLVDRDFRQMHLANVNTILTYTVPSDEPRPERTGKNRSATVCPRAYWRRSI